MWCGDHRLILRSRFSAGSASCDCSRKPQGGQHTRSTGSGGVYSEGGWARTSLRHVPPPARPPPVAAMRCCTVVFKSEGEIAFMFTCSTCDETNVMYSSTSVYGCTAYSSSNVIVELALTPGGDDMRVTRVCGHALCV